MREIKFRAWDKVTRKMTFGGSWHTLELGGVNQEWFGMKTPHPDDCELMQYTGLKDKKGKEIYEGDIVTDEFNGKWIVGWSVKYASFVACKENEPNGSMLLTNLLDETSEVIGNIYQNPELLEKDLI